MLRKTTERSDDAKKDTRALKLEAAVDARYDLNERAELKVKRD